MGFKKLAVSLKQTYFVSSAKTIQRAPTSYNAIQQVPEHLYRAKNHT